MDLSFDSDLWEDSKKDDGPDSRSDDEKLSKDNVDESPSGLGTVEIDINMYVN